MENNLENKAKFFAQYWGQNLMKLVKKTDFFDVEVGAMTINNRQFDKHFLELTPLSMISDEDAVEVKKLCDIDFTMIMRSKEAEYRAFMSTRFTVVADYLRSKGYALPFMGLSVEQQIEYGWITLNQK